MITDTNYNILYCPYCKTNITQHANYDCGIAELEAEKNDFFSCPECEKLFKVELEIYSEVHYNIKKPSEHEIKKYGLDIKKEDEIKDCPGQIFMW